MKKLLIASFILVSLMAFGQSEDQINIGFKEKIESKVLDETREIWVHLPINMQENKRYPVVYLLDGSGHFYSVVGLIKQLSTVNGNTAYPEMIVVGITNTDRMRDLTPQQAQGYATAGGGENFMNFIKDELIPHVEAKYPTAPYRTFIGHSLGGLMAMYAISNYTDLFDAYIAIDPSMWWAKKAMLNEIKAGFADRDFKDKSLYVGIANTMSADGNIETIREDSSPSTQHIRSILEMDEFLNEISESTGLKYASKYYPKTTHGTVPIISEYDGLNFIFDFYEFRVGITDFDDPEVLMNRLTSHFQKTTEEMGYSIAPSEQMVFMIGSRFLNTNALDYAKRCFELNLSNYPESASAYEAMGDYYIAKSNNEQAYQHFKKSLELNESASVRQKLEGIEKE